MMILLAAAMLGPASQTTEGSPEKAIVAMHRLANCLVQHRRGQVLAMLQQIPSSAEERAAAHALAAAAEDCLGEAAGEMIQAEGTTTLQMRFPSSALFRGPLFEALYKQDFENFGLRHGRNPVPLPDVATMEKAPNLPDRARPFLVLDGVAACVVTAKPAESLALLGTTPASGDEDKAVDTLVPALDPCFAGKDRITVNRPMLRGFIAEAAYRHASAAQGVRR